MILTFGNPPIYLWCPSPRLEYTKNIVWLVYLLTMSAYFFAKKQFKFLYISIQMLMNAKQNLVNVQQTSPGVKQHVATGLGASNAPVIMAMN